MNHCAATGMSHGGRQRKAGSRHHFPATAGKSWTAWEYKCFPANAGSRALSRQGHACIRDMGRKPPGAAEGGPGRVQGGARPPFWAPRSGACGGPTKSATSVRLPRPSANSYDQPTCGPPGLPFVAITSRKHLHPQVLTTSTQETLAFPRFRARDQLGLPWGGGARVHLPPGVH